MPARVVSNSLGVVAGRSCDHSPSSFVSLERKQFIQCAPLFECAGALLIIEFEENRVVSERRKRFRAWAWRDPDISADSLSSVLDVREPNHGEQLSYMGGNAPVAEHRTLES